MTMNRRSFLKALASCIVLAGAAPAVALALVEKRRGIVSHFDMLYGIDLLSRTYLSTWWAPIGAGIVGPLLWKHEGRGLIIYRPERPDVVLRVPFAGRIEEMVLVGQVRGRTVSSRSNLLTGATQVEYLDASP